VNTAVITHGHSDHARRGSGHYICQQDTVGILRLRLGADISVQGLGYNEVISSNGVTISLHPAGHIIGSAQVRLEYKGEIWVVSAEYKLRPDSLSCAFEVLK